MRQLFVQVLGKPDDRRALNMLERRFWSPGGLCLRGDTNASATPDVVDLAQWRAAKEGSSRR